MNYIYCALILLNISTNKKNSPKMKNKKNLLNFFWTTYDNCNIVSIMTHILHFILPEMS